MHRQSVATFLAALILTAGLERSNAAQQRSPDGLWEPVTAGAGADFQPLGGGPDFVRPQAFRLYQLDGQGAVARLQSARPVLDNDSPRITFPRPDGSYLTFRVQETRTMSPALAEQNPELRTYRGVGVEDPAATVRFERDGSTLNAMLLTTDGRSFVTPVRQLGAIRYLAYARRTDGGAPPQAPAQPPGQRQICLLDAELAQAARDEDAVLANRRDPVPPGSVLRTYRLAVGTTAEYTAKKGGVNAALAAIVSTINRVNEVYERDVAVRFELIGRQKDLIQTDAADNGYTNDSPRLLADENQGKIDGIVGAGAYDIGHVFSTGPGGYAPGLVCQNGKKARASTGRADPTGDPFAIDYVAHEFGHQFTAGHTFNTTQGCGGRYAATAWEPGSGSTIMAYAGICDGENVEMNTSPYFHSGSLDEIVRYAHTGTGTTCGTTTSTGNRPPIVKVTHRSVTIPYSTPFVLTGTAGDPDGDTLTYAWEQMDLGLSAPPNDDADGKRRPLFRSLPPSGDATRTFPAVAHIGAPGPVLGHTLPAIARRLKFRLTARDGRTAGGGFGHAETHVTVLDRGPFKVVLPANGTTWTAGSTQVVEWDPAGTHQNPLAIADVRIVLSLDGGHTFPIELHPSVPNTGRASVDVPAVSTSRGRVRVEAIGGVFFNLSSGDLTIRQ